MDGFDYDICCYFDSHDFINFNIQKKRSIPLIVSDSIMLTEAPEESL